MKRLLMSLSLVATLGVGCSHPAQEDAPQTTPQVKKKTQALGTERVTLEEVAVSAAVQAAVEGQATVRAFRIVASEQGVNEGDIVAAAQVAGDTGSASLPWESDPARGQDETRRALKYLDGLIPALEAEVGTGEEYSSGYQHWFQQSAEDLCDHGDRYSVVFKQAGMVFLVQVSGRTEC
jgi:hypothetical protein